MTHFINAIFFSQLLSSQVQGSSHTPDTMTSDKTEPPPMRCFKCWCVARDSDPPVCFVCGKNGHAWYDCGTYCGDNICFQCNTTGHREDTWPKRGATTSQSDEPATEKKKKKKKGNEMWKVLNRFDLKIKDACRICSKKGHKQGRCQEVCFLCGDSQHRQHRCPMAPWYKDGKCHTCGSLVEYHNSSCNAMKWQCNRCGERHRPSKCPYTVAGKHLCWHCKSVAHMSWQCPTVTGQSTIDDDDAGDDDGDDDGGGVDGGDKEAAGAVVVEPSIPSRPAWEARKAVKECSRCGQRGHGYKDCSKTLKAAGGGGSDSLPRASVWGKTARLKTAHLDIENGKRVYRSNDTGEIVETVENYALSNEVMVVAPDDARAGVTAAPAVPNTRKVKMCFKCGIGATHATNDCPLLKVSCCEEMMVRCCEPGKVLARRLSFRLVGG